MSTKARFLALTLAVIFAVPAHAATQNAVVYGTVYDAAGNAMPGVSVALENAALGFTRSAITGSDGSYNFAEVPPADDYKLTASKDGKTLDIRAGIAVNVGDERVILPPLKEQAAAATGGQVVAQTAGGQAVSNETVSTSLGGVITGDQLRSLPLYNRNFLVLGLLTPSTRDVEAGSELAGASFSVAGNRPSSNSFLLDGSDNVASSSNQAVPFQVNDSIQEFRVTSSTATAEYGRNQGGTVNVVTRRGSNAFHGSAYGYFASDALNADSPLSVYNGTTFDQNAAYAGPTTGAPLFSAAPLNYNDYVRSAQAAGFCTNSLDATGNPASGTPCATGGFFGGGLGFTGRNDVFDPAAILAANDRRDIPFDSKQFGVSAGGALSQDKLFFFASYEGTRIDNPTPIFERVPTDFDRSYDPYGTQLNQPGAFRLYPDTDPNFQLSQGILSLFPASNVVGVPGVLEFFRGEAPNFTNVDNGLFRLDYKQSDEDSWTGRYAVQRLNQLHSSTLPEQSNYPGNGAFRNALNQNLSLSYAHTFSPTVINEIRGGFNRFRVDETAQDAGFDATTLGSSNCTIFGVANLNCTLPNSALPTILLNGLDTQQSGATPGVNGFFCGWADQACNMFPVLDYLFPFARLGAPLTAPSERADTTLFVADNLSITQGRHTVRLGGEYRHLRNRVANGAFTRGFMYSSNIGEFTADSETCNEGCGFFSGQGDAFRAPSFDFAQFQAEDYAARFDSYGASLYVQDTWRIHPRWTLNFGVRYEYFSPPEEVGDRVFNYEDSAGGLVQQNRAGPVLDPYGLTCPNQPVTYDSIPPAQSGSIPPFISPPWSCTPDEATGKIINSDKNNLAARGGIAWDLWGDGKTVMRFGIGWYYDHLPTSYLYPLLFNRPTTGNAVYGQLTEFFAFGVCTLFQCGTGVSMANPSVQAALSPDGINPNGFHTVASSPFGVYGRDAANSNAPFSRQMSASVQQSLTNKLAFEVGYVGTSAKQLPIVFNSNFSTQFNFFSPTGGNFQKFPIFTMTHQADSSYHSLMMRVRGEDWHGLRFHAAYSLSNSEDNASTGFYPTLPITLNNLVFGYQTVGTDSFATCVVQLAGCAVVVPDPNDPQNSFITVPIPLGTPNISFNPAAVTTSGAGQVLTSRYLVPQDPFNFLADERGRSDFHTKHRFVLDYTWDVPLGKGTVLGHWQLSGIFAAQSGQPFSIFAGPLLGQVTQRAMAVGPVTITNNPNGAIDPSNLRLSNATTFDPVTFTLTPTFCPLDATVPGQFLPSLFQPSPGVACTGSTRRNEFTGPNLVNFNFAVQKGFPVFGEGRMLTIRAEFYNLTNRANFYNPISAMSVDGFNPNPDFGKIKSARDPRQIQVAARFTW